MPSPAAVRPWVGRAFRQTIEKRADENREGGPLKRDEQDGLPIIAHGRVPIRGSGSGLGVSRASPRIRRAGGGSYCFGLRKRSAWSLAVDRSVSSDDSRDRNVVR